MSESESAATAEAMRKGKCDKVGRSEGAAGVAVRRCVLALAVFTRETYCIVVSGVPCKFITVCVVFEKTKRFKLDELEWLHQFYNLSFIYPYKVCDVRRRESFLPRRWVVETIRRQRGQTRKHEFLFTQRNVRRTAVALRSPHAQTKCLCLRCSKYLCTIIYTAEYLRSVV